MNFREIEVCIVQSSHLFGKFVNILYCLVRLIPNIICPEMDDHSLGILIYISW